MWRVSVFSINDEAASHLVWIPGCYFSPNHRSPLSHRLQKWPLFQNLDSDVGFTAHEWSLSSCEVWKWSKWPSPDTRGTEWQLWGPLDQTPNTKHPGLSWHCALFPRDSSVTVFILIFLLQGPDFTKSTILTFHWQIGRTQPGTLPNMCNWSWRWYFWEI